MLTLFLYRTDKVNNGSYSSASSSIRQKGHFSEKKKFFVGQFQIIISSKEIRNSIR